MIGLYVSEYCYLGDKEKRKISLEVMKCIYLTTYIVSVLFF